MHMQPFFGLGMLKSGNHPEFRCFPRPRADAQGFLPGDLQVFQVLLQCRFIKPGEKLRIKLGIDLADVVDELTFAHGALTFRVDLHKIEAPGGDRRYKLPANRGIGRWQPEA